MGYHWELLVFHWKDYMCGEKPDCNSSHVGNDNIVHMGTGRIVKSPGCWHVPVAVVVPTGPACVHVKNDMSHHSVGGFTKVTRGHMLAH